jgi:hypothetical protein
MAEYTPVDLVVTEDHTEESLAVGFVYEGAFVAITTIPSGYVKAAVDAASSADDHPLAVESSKPANGRRKQTG